MYMNNSYLVDFSETKSNKKYHRYLNDNETNPFHLVSIAIANCLQDEFIGKPDTFETNQAIIAREKELLRFLLDKNYF